MCKFHTVKMLKKNNDIPGTDFCACARVQNPFGKNCHQEYIRFTNASDV